MYSPRCAKITPDHTEQISRRAIVRACCFELIIISRHLFFCGPRKILHPASRTYSRHILSTLAMLPVSNAIWILFHDTDQSDYLNSFEHPVFSWVQGELRYQTGITISQIGLFDLHLAEQVPFEELHIKSLVLPGRVVQIATRSRVIWSTKHQWSCHSFNLVNHVHSCFGNGKIESAPVKVWSGECVINHRVPSASLPAEAIPMTLRNVLPENSERTSSSLQGLQPSPRLASAPESQSLAPRDGFASSKHLPLVSWTACHRTGPFFNQTGSSVISPTSFTLLIGRNAFNEF